MTDVPKLVIPGKESTNAKETLNGHLEQADVGKISAIAVTVIYVDGKISSDYSVDNFIHMDTLVGAIEHLKYRILAGNVSLEEGK